MEDEVFVCPKCLGDGIDEEDFCKACWLCDGTGTITKSIWDYYHENVDMPTNKEDEDIPPEQYEP